MTIEYEIARDSLGHILAAEYLLTQKDPPPRSVMEALYLAPDDVVFEFGAGNGHFTLPMARYFQRLHGKGLVFAVDFSKSLVTSLEQRAHEYGLDTRVRAICLQEISPHTLPVSNERIDSVLAANSVQYMGDPLPYLREFERILKPGASLLIADWRREPKEGLTIGKPNEHKPEYLTPLLLEAGFAHVEPLNLEGYTFALCATKPIVIEV